MQILLVVLVLFIGLALHFASGINRGSVTALGIPTYFAALLVLLLMYAQRIIEFLKVH